MEMFDQLVVTRFVTDEEQVQEIEFNEAQEAFCECPVAGRTPRSRAR